MVFSLLVILTDGTNDKTIYIPGGNGMVFRGEFVYFLNIGNDGVEEVGRAYIKELKAVVVDPEKRM